MQILSFCISIKSPQRPAEYYLQTLERLKKNVLLISVNQKYLLSSNQFSPSSNNSKPVYVSHVFLFFFFYWITCDISNYVNGQTIKGSCKEFVNDNDRNRIISSSNSPNLIIRKPCSRSTSPLPNIESRMHCIYCTQVFRTITVLISLPR